ncbi:MAG: hypothetical protein AB1649_06570 [Chloroflexota bacterium]
MKAKLLLQIGGIINLLLVAFHLAFWKLFDWGQSLASLSADNRAIMQVLNVHVAYALAMFALLSLLFPHELTATKVGRIVSASIAGFWILRAINQAAFRGLSFAESWIELFICIVIAALYVIPLAGKRAIQNQAGGAMHLNDFLPDYEFHEVHTITINASPERVFAALKELTNADFSPLVALLLGIRNLPARLLKKTAPGPSQNGPFLEGLYKSGFIPLAEDPGCEIVFGLVGQFWKLIPDVKPHIPNGEAFLAFDDPAFAKVAANLAVHANGRGRTLCTTETRIHASDPVTRRKFAFYWGIISLGSALIRVLWLRAIKRKAEKATPR